MMTISRGQKLSQRLSWFKMQRAGEGGMPQRVDCSLEEIVPVQEQPVPGRAQARRTHFGNNKAWYPLSEKDLGRAKAL